MLDPTFILRLPLQLLPDALHEQLMALAANHLLRGQHLATRLGELEERVIGLAVSDTGTRLHFCIRGGRLHPAHHLPANVVIRGSLEAFWQLATRAEDPDTLFFHRRLSVEGETETGVHIKNLLDAFDYDWEAHVRAVLGERLGAMLSPLTQRP